ncbi:MULTISPECIES: hypothetical protein [unclassified Rickettsia]|uniref:hypothetical protein n=1 Tax=unclassified Rickettsia TaxID=114295 RepID=UPI003132A08B
MQQRCICVERGNLDNNKFHSIFCYFFLDCRVGTSSLLAMTIPVSTQAIPPCNDAFYFFKISNNSNLV